MYKDALGPELFVFVCFFHSLRLLSLSLTYFCETNPTLICRYEGKDMAKNTSSLNFSLSLGHRHRHKHKHLAKSQVSSANRYLNEKEEDQRKTKILGKGSNQLSVFKTSGTCTGT